MSVNEAGQRGLSRRLPGPQGGHWSSKWEGPACRELPSICQPLGVGTPERGPQSQSGCLQRPEGAWACWPLLSGAPLGSAFGGAVGRAKGVTSLFSFTPHNGPRGESGPRPHGAREERGSEAA